MTEKEVLENAYEVAKTLDLVNVSPIIKKDVDVLIEKIEGNKSLVSALVTSLVKKSIEPSQDIRLHRTDFEKGYSARVLDTQVISPFFKDKFPKYANAQTSFLTLSLRAEIKWDKIEGQNLKIQDEKLKESFLNIFEQIEEQKAQPQGYLHYILAKLISLTQKDSEIFETVQIQSSNIGALNIPLILKMLEEHFSSERSSRLPVIAIYSIYEILMTKIARYKDKKLLPLQVHTSSDKHSFGDIEVYTNEGEPFEIIEIKHNIPLDKYLILDIVKKTEGIPINRYYILTTFEGSFANKVTEQEVINTISSIQQSVGIEIIPNGIITSLKYYLRFIDDYQEFIQVYTKNLIHDAQKSTEIKESHLTIWNEILIKNEIPKDEST